MLQPTMWLSTGEMELADGDKRYTYYGVIRDVYDLAVRLCNQGRRGECFQLLSGFAKEEV